MPTTTVPKCDACGKFMSYPAQIVEHWTEYLNSTPSQSEDWYCTACVNGGLK